MTGTIEQIGSSLGVSIETIGIHRVVVKQVPRTIDGVPTRVRQGPTTVGVVPSIVDHEPANFHVSVGQIKVVFLVADVLEASFSSSLVIEIIPAVVDALSAGLSGPVVAIVVRIKVVPGPVDPLPTSIGPNIGWIKVECLVVKTGQS